METITSEAEIIELESTLFVILGDVGDTIESGSYTFDVQTVVGGEITTIATNVMTFDIPADVDMVSATIHG